MSTIKSNKLIHFQILFIFAVIFVTGGIVGLTFGIPHAYAETTISFDSVSTSSANNVDSLTFSHTVTTSGFDRIVVVGVVTKQSNVTAITYGGQSLTKEIEINNSNNVRAEIWYLVDPPTGSNSVSISLDVSDGRITAGALSFTGVSQNKPIVSSASTVGESITPFVSITANNTNVIVDVMGTQQTDGVVGANQTERWRQPHDNVISGQASTKNAADGSEVSWTLNESRLWAIVAVILNPDTVIPTFSSAALNEGTGVLDITFSEIIDIASVDLSKLFISDTGNVDEIALTGSTIDTGSNSDTISITLTESQRQSIITLATPELDVSADAVADRSGNTLDATADQTITATDDIVKPIFTAKTGPATNQIIITFSENIDSTSDDSSQWTVVGNTVTGVTTLDGTTNTLTITLDTVLSAGTTPDVTYTAGDIADFSSNAMDTTTVASTDGLAPNVISARLSINIITIIYDRPVNTVLDDYSDLVTSDISTPNVTSIAGSGARVIAITISSDVPAGTTGTIDISSGVTSVDGAVPIDPVNDQNITAEDIVTLSGSDDTIAVTEKDSILSTVTYPSTLISKINFTAIAKNNTVTTNKQITTTMTGSTGGNAELRLAANTTITGPEFTGNLFIPSDLGFDVCGIVPATGLLTSCIQVGQSDASLSISPPARIALSGQAGNIPWFKTDVGITTEITTACTADTIAAATSQLSPGPPNECHINVGSDLVIWTNHFTQFGSGTQPPSGGGGSSGDQTPPSIVTTFEDMNYPVTIDDYSYTAEQLKDPVSTKIVETENPVIIELLLYENGGPQNVKYVEMYVNRHGTLILNDLTETSVIWDDDKGVDMTNPNGIISDATVERTIQDNKVLFTFDVTFAKEFDISDIVFNVWDSNRNGLKFVVIDALQVIPREPSAILKEPAIKTVDRQKDLSESAPEPDVTAVVPEPDATIVSEPDATIVSEPDATIVSEPDATAVVPEPGVDVWSEDQKLVIEMWVGYHPESTSDYYLLNSVYFDTYGKNVDTTDYVIPSWVKKHLATWVLTERVNFEDFVNAVKYMYGKNLF